MTQSLALSTHAVSTRLGLAASVSAVVALMMRPLAASAQTVLAGKGDVAGLNPVVNQIRSALGMLNSHAPVNVGPGRREINWDGVPDARFDPHSLPSSFFNGDVSPRVRGLVLSTPGLGWRRCALNCNMAEVLLRGPAAPLALLHHMVEATTPMPMMATVQAAVRR